MKRIYIAVAFIIISLAAAVSELCYVSSSVDYFTEKISISDDCIENEEYTKAAELMREIEKEWQESTRITDVLLIHDYVDSIGGGISVMRSFSQSKSRDDYFSESARVKKELASIKESEFVYLENIF